jgi:hypothetical protein
VDLYKKKDVSLPKTKYLYLRWTNSFCLSFRFEYGIIERRTQVIYEIYLYSSILFYNTWLTLLPKFSDLQHNIISTVGLATLTGLHNY